MNTLIKEMELNDDLVGYVLTLADDRIVQIQYEEETNVLHADCGEFYAVIDKQNEDSAKRELRCYE